MVKKFFPLLMCIFYLTVAPSSTSSGQDAAPGYYMQKTADYAALYSGQMEAPYSAPLYQSLPYFVSDEFSTGSVNYNRIEYRNVRLRLDLYREQLIILTPEAQYGVILDPSRIERAYLHNHTAIWHTKEGNKDPEEGYYLLPYESPSIQLLKKEKYQIDRTKMPMRFYLKTKYYLKYNGEFYPLKNKNSFHRIFPEYKKEIDRFTKEQRLNFNAQREESLILLAKECERLAIRRSVN